MSRPLYTIEVRVLEHPADRRRKPTVYRELSTAPAPAGGDLVERILAAEAIITTFNNADHLALRKLRDKLGVE